MLVDEPNIVASDPFLSVIAEIRGGAEKACERLELGCYSIAHFGGSHFLRGYEHYPELSVGSYGVCDSLEQLKAKCPELQDSNRQFVVTLTEIRRDKEPAKGGWRWHKWGEYIGAYTPRHEYLYDETEIERVFVYHIYENKA